MFNELKYKANLRDNKFIYKIIKISLEIGIVLHKST